MGGGCEWKMVKKTWIYLVDKGWVREGDEREVEGVASNGVEL